MVGWADRDMAAKWNLTDAQMNESTSFEATGPSYSIGSQYTVNDLAVEKIPGFDLSPVELDYF